MGEKLDMEEKRPDESGSKFYVIVLTMFATIGGLLFGYDTGIISGSMLLIRDDFQLSEIWQSAIVSSTIGAAAVFSLIAGVLVDKIGRKKVIMMASFIFTAGAILMAVSPVDKKEILLIGRLIVGAGIGKYESKLSINAYYPLKIDLSIDICEIKNSVSCGFSRLH